MYTELLTAIISEKSWGGGDERGEIRKKIYLLLSPFFYISNVLLCSIDVFF